MTPDHVSSRRRFLRTAVASAGGVALAACGGGAASTPAQEPAAGAGEPQEPIPSPAPTPAPAPAPLPTTGGGTYTYQLASNDSLALPAGTTTRIAAGATGMIVEVSPDLPPGRTLTVSSGGEVAIVSAPDAPPVDIRRPWIIEVMPSPIATIRNASKGITYPPGQTWPAVANQPANRWNAVMGQASPGDVIEISPGAVHESPADMRNYWSSNLNSAMLAIWKPCTIRNMSGRGRWRPYRGTDLMQTGITGICIYAPAALDPAGRGTFVVEGFELDNWGMTSEANGIRIMAGGSVAGSWNNVHASVTLRNFKIGKLPYERSASGVSGAAEALTLENGHIYDTGAGLYAPDGNDHNAYVSARTLTVRGVRFQRSRGLNAQGWWMVPDTDMDGHMLKASAVNASIEGCVFDADPVYGDNTHHIQAKAGGNFLIRGCLFVDSVHNQSQGRGPINMCREYSADGTKPNFEWWAGLEGNSLIVEKCVFVGHYGRAAVYFFPSGHKYNEGLSMSGVTVRDNIGMIAATPTVLAPFDSNKWILNDPTDGGSWTGRGNTVMPYAADEPGFGDKRLLRYLRTDGPVAAPRAVSTYRFVYPHGYEERHDAFGGLG